MADKYYRLVSFLVNICTQTLRELFVKYMQADPTRLPTCTTLGGYLVSRKPQLQILWRRKVIRQNQWNLLFPKNGQVDGSTWDTTLVILLIDEFFQVRLQQIEEDAINDIRGIRNRLQHMAATTLTDVDFDDMWKILESATIHLARQIQPSPMYEQNIKECIDDTKINNMPKLGDTLRYWYENTIFKLQCDLDDMKDIMLEMAGTTADNLKCTTDCRTILQDNVVTKVDSAGNRVKCIKTFDHILSHMNHTFKTTMKEDFKSGFQSPKEIADIKTTLRETNHVFVTGIRGSRYLETALATINDFGFDINRCVEMRKSSDWRHIDPEEVDLVLCKEPFGDFSFDENRAKSMVDIFDSMHKSAKPTDGSKTVAIVIVSVLDFLHKVSNTNKHILLEDVVHVYQQTTANNPEDLTVSSIDGEISTTLQNLLDFSAIFMERHNYNLHPKVVFDQAKAQLKKNKVITITGPRKSGKTSLAIKLSSAAHQPHQILILKKPEDMKFVNLNHICIIIIDDFPGKYRFEEARACAWLEEFEILNSIVSAGKLNVIVTCEETLLQKCYDEFSTHPMLENSIALKGEDIVVECKEENAEISRVDEGAVCKEAIQTAGTSSIVYNRDRKKPMISFTGVKEIDIIDICHPIQNRNYLNFCQCNDGSFMFAETLYKTRLLVQGVIIHHVSSEFKYIRQYETDLLFKPNCICCTDTGELVVTRGYRVHLCRITDGTFQIKKSIKFLAPCLSLCFSNKRILCLLNGTRKVKVLDKNLQKKQTVTLLKKPLEKRARFIFVNISIQMFVYRNVSGDIVFEHLKHEQFKYLRAEGFVPLCACAGGEDSVFMLGRQDRETSRILQVNTDLGILTDIVLQNNVLSLDGSRRCSIAFDTSNSRLVLFKPESNKITELCLK